MNRIDRLHAIVTHLQSKKKVTAEEMADRFEISLRTVYRDVKALEEAGVPVIGEAGFGYSIMEGYRLPPVMFTREEAGSLLLGAKLAEQFTDHSVRRHFDTALYKIKAVLRSADKDYMDDLTDHIEILRNHIPADELTTHYMSSLQQALVQKRVVQISYVSGYKEENTTRSIEPVGLCHYGQGWHLVGWCRLREDYRDFRLSRIKQLVIQEEVFNQKDHPSIKEYIQQTTRRTDLQEVIISFDKKVARYLKEQKYYYGMVEEEETDDRIRMKFLTGCPYNIGRWLLMYTNHARIESPDSMKDIMREMVKALSQQYL